MNFVAISFNPNKSLTYALRLNEIQDDKGKEIGEYIIDGNSFIYKFTPTQNESFLVMRSLTSNGVESSNSM